MPAQRVLVALVLERASHVRKIVFIKESHEWREKHGTCLQPSTRPQKRKHIKAVAKLQTGPLRGVRCVKKDVLARK
jgi:hypothetical protein